MSDFVNTIDLIGDNTLTDSIIDRSITELIDNNITNVGKYAFYNCSKLNTVNLPEVESIGESAFQNCTGLTSVSIPSATYIGDSAFGSCSNLESVEFPMITTINETAFWRCSKLSNINFPKVETILYDAFDGCSSLQTADFPQITRIDGNALFGCRNLTSLIIRKTDVVCTLGSNALKSTKIASGTGYIYVPAALLDSYKTASNWSTYAEQFRALEDYTVDGTTTGELDSTKI